MFRFDRISLVISVIVSLGSGVVIASIWECGVLAELTIGNVLQSVATVFSGFVVARYVQLALQAERKERDLVFRQIDFAMSFVDNLHDAELVVSHLSVTALLKNISVSLNHFFELATYLKYPKKILESTKLKKLFREVRELATMTAITQNQDDQAKSAVLPVVSGGMINYSISHKSMLNSKLREIRLELIKLQIEINRI